jgi:hypothetical protein
MEVTPLLLCLALVVWRLIGWLKRRRLRAVMEQEGRLPSKPLMGGWANGVVPLVLGGGGLIGILVLLSRYPEWSLAVGLILVLITVGVLVVRTLGDWPAYRAQNLLIRGGTESTEQTLAGITENVAKLRLHAEAVAAQGQHMRAAELYAQAATTEGGSVECSAHRIRQLQLASELEMAQAELEQLRSAHPEQATLALLACRQHLLLGERQFAIEQYRQALELMDAASSEQKFYMTPMQVECQLELGDEVGPRAFEVIVPRQDQANP